MLRRNCLPSRSTGVHSRYLMGSCCSIFSFLCNVLSFCRFFAIVCLFFDLRLLISIFKLYCNNDRAQLIDMLWSMTVTQYVRILKAKVSRYLIWKTGPVAHMSGLFHISNLFFSFSTNSTYQCDVYPLVGTRRR